MIPAFIAKDSVRRECVEVILTGGYFAGLFAITAGLLYLNDRYAMCAAFVALAGVCAGVAIGADSVRRQV